MGVDPGKHKLALASLDIYGSGPVAVASSEEWDWKWLRSVLKEWFVPGSLLVVEGQYARLNIGTALSLASVRGFVEGVASMLGYRVRPNVMPSAWQASFGLKGKREKRKEGSRARASLIAGAEVTDTDIADALCIAEWLRKGIRDGQG